MKRLLPSIMVLLLVLGIARLADGQGTAAGDGKKKTLKDLIVGKWEPEKLKDAKGIKGILIEYTYDNKFSMLVTLDEDAAALLGKAEISRKGTYKLLDNDIVEISMTDEKGKEKRTTSKLVVTETSLTVTPLDGKNKGREEKLKRVK